MAIFIPIDRNLQVCQEFTGVTTPMLEPPKIDGNKSLTSAEYSTVVGTFDTTLGNFNKNWKLDKILQKGEGIKVK